MMTKLNADGTPMPTEKHKTFEEALEMLRNTKVDPAIQKMLDDAGGNLKVEDIANNKDLSEEAKTRMLGALGYQYP